MKIGEYTVHIVDDEETVRKSLAFLLTMAGFTARVHESATSFLAVAPGLRCCCLVTDLRMPDMNGVDLLRQLGASNAMMPAIVVTGHADVPMAVAAMKAGAVDFIEKPFEDEVLFDAIKRAAERIGGPESDTDNAAVVQSRLELLSERERQVLSAVVDGKPNKSIAYELDISPRTVEVHRANVMAKMQAKSLPELVRMTFAVKRSEA